LQQGLRSIAAVVFVGHTSTLIFSESSPATQKDFVATMVSIAHPILDAVLIVPAIIVLASPRHGDLTFIPWFRLSSAILITAAPEQLCLL